MRAKDIIKVYVEKDYQVLDITDGIIEINTFTGIDSFEGDFQTPDAGQFTILSRNASIDPHINDFIRFNSYVTINMEDQSNSYTVFRGYITDVNVEYRVNEPPLITINGTDEIGLLNRTIIDQQLIDDINSTYGPFTNDVVPLDIFLTATTGYIYQGRAATQGGLDIDPYIPDLPLIKMEVGKSYWELISKCLRTALASTNFEPIFNALTIYPFYKYDTSFWAPNFDNPVLGTGRYEYEFVSHPNINPAAYNYKFIKVNDGFDRVVNQIDISNIKPEDQTTSEYGTYVSANSLTEWGPASLSIDTTFSENQQTTPYADPTIEDKADRYAEDILQVSDTPTVEINSITVDMVKQFGSNFGYPPPVIGAMLDITHQINETEFITGWYKAIGVNYSINESEWFGEFILRKLEDQIYLDKRSKEPIISINAMSGDTNTSFTASVTNYSAGEYSRIEWELNGQYYLQSPMPPSLRYDPVPVEFTGISQTWNYDDNGVLAPFGPSGYGSNAHWCVQVWVTDNDGFVRSAVVGPISISSAQVHADFSYNINQYGGVTFVDASSPDVNSWSWDFGDSTTSTLENPPIKYYTSNGNKTVTLTVNNGFTSDTETKTVSITNATIPVRFVKFEWDTSYSSAPGGDYSDFIINNIGQIDIWSSSSALSSNCFVDKDVTTGDFYRSTTGQVWVPDGSVGSINTKRILTNGDSFNTGHVTMVPQTTTVGNVNTQTYDGSLIVEMQYQPYLPSPLALNDITPRFDITQYIQIRHKTTGIKLNVVSKPINVYVSEDKINWYKIGEFKMGPYTTYPTLPAGAFYLSNLVPTIPQFPPRYPTP